MMPTHTVMASKLNLALPQKHLPQQNLQSWVPLPLRMTGLGWSLSSAQGLFAVLPCSLVTRQPSALKQHITTDIDAQTAQKA